MGLSSGMKLGPYEVLEPIGAGGQGEVFLEGDESQDASFPAPNSTPLARRTLSISLSRRLFTAEEFRAMAEAGVLKEDDRLEFVDGDRRNGSNWTSSRDLRSKDE